MSWAEFFEEFKYKPGWVIDYIGDEIDIERNQKIPERIRVVMKVPDSRATPENFNKALQQTTVNGVRIPLVPVTLERFLPFWDGEDYAKHYMRRLLADLELHEMDEWIRYKGELIFDPHK